MKIVVLAEDKRKAQEINRKLKENCCALEQETDQEQKLYFDHDGQEINYEEYLELKEFWVLDND